MAIVSWNVRGLNGEEALRQTKLLIKYHNPEILFLMETRLSEGRVDTIRNKMGFKQGIEFARTGLGGGIMLLWKDNVKVTYLTSSTNHISCLIRFEDQQRNWHFCGFYGDPKVANRHFTWDLLQKLGTVFSGPWLVMGDFNEILSQVDKDGGRARNATQIEAFRNSLEVCEIQPLEYKGDHYTWIRNNVDGCIKERLDWAMVNEAWLDLYPSNSLTHLDFFHSDHRALLLELQDPLRPLNKRKRSRFRFENMWVKEPDCRNIITSNWNSTNQSALMATINNIKQCSTILSSWNKTKFGSMATDIKETHQRIIQLHNLQEPGMSENLKEMKQKLNDLLWQEEVFWKQRSRIQWLKAGDQNTKFFHARAKTRHKNNTIKGLLNEENEWCSNNVEISGVVQRFYQDLFKSISPSEERIDTLLIAVQPLVTEEMNSSLEQDFSLKEIEDAMFSMSTEKSPGPDGMNAMFYKKHWDVVGPTVTRAVMDCLNEKEDLVPINSTLVTLIPKVTEPMRVSEYRPISLCNVIYKVISKVLINRLKSILPVIINGTQSAFVPGRLITDNALIAYECLHYLRSMKGGKKCYVTMKLDMSKAYDRVEWVFIKKMLLKLGFTNQWVNKIMRCVTSVRYSFQINGQTYGKVIPSRGLRQGDPLSPYLFLICAEGFSALLRQAENRRDILGLKIARSAPAISHLFFADDSMLIFQASERSLLAIQSTFALYSDCSGQMINYNKSLLFFSPNTPEAVCSLFIESLNMQRTGDIETYLGLPMMGGRNKSVIFRPIKDKIWMRLNSWKETLFSQAGKEILLKNVIQAMPTYLMSCFKIPEGQCLEIERLMARYWWGSFQSKRKIHWKSWESISIPKSDGGLGFRKLVLFNQALLAKQAWRLITDPMSLIARVLKARYFTNTNFLEAREGNCPSLSWRGICWGKSLLLKGLRRRIGNGQDTKAFNDPWIPRSPSFLPITQGSEERKVSEFIEEHGKWNKDLIKRYFHSPDAQLIHSIPLSLFNHSDSWLWHYTKNGSYTVKSGYNLAASMDKTGPSTSSNVLSGWWKVFWATKIPRKVLMFGWRGFHEILPTGCGLNHRNVSIHSNCPLCGFGKDSNAHAVFWCPFAQELWALLEFSFLVGQKDDIPFKGVLFYATDLLEKDSFERMLIAAWSLWSERNRRTHGQQPRTIHQLKGGVFSYMEELKKIQESDDDAIGRSSSLLKESELDQNNFALFVDAAISSDTNMVGLGAAIFTPNKRIQATLSKPLEGLLSALNAEALALVVGLKWTQTIGIPVKTIFSDSLCVVSALTKPELYHNELGILLSDIKTLMSSFNDANISHVNRKYNIAAHNLAKKALQQIEEQSWMDGSLHHDDLNI